MNRTLVLLLMTLAVQTMSVSAQDASLTAVDAAMARGATEDARRQLDAWWAANGAASAAVSSRVRARAIFLRAELSTDARQSQDDYLTVALDFPTAPEASAALLRGAQALFMRGEPERARTYLERLRRDYPGGPHHATGLLWLARVRTATRSGDACEAADAGLAAAGEDQELHALLAAEKARCTPLAAEPPAAVPPAARPAPVAGAPANRTAQEVAGSYAVQVGAFRAAAGARALAARLRELGYDSRIVVVPGNALLRVRVGRFEGVTPARELLRKLAESNIDGVVVVDADDEKNPE